MLNNETSMVEQIDEKRQKCFGEFIQSTMICSCRVEANIFVIHINNVESRQLITAWFLVTLFKPFHSTKFCFRGDK